MHFAIVTREITSTNRKDVGVAEGEAMTGDIEREQMQRKHVLAVNGDTAFLDLIRELLQDERYNVTTTNYVPKTFDLIACLQPSLLIVDLVIGEVAGWELLDRLQAEAITQGIPVIATSTMQRLLDRASADQARYGSNQYLVKPFDLDDLIDTTRRLIGPA
jgi:CheY-like chemotaxis protein